MTVSSVEPLRAADGFTPGKTSAASDIPILICRLQGATLFTFTLR